MREIYNYGGADYCFMSPDGMKFVIEETTIVGLDSAVNYCREFLSMTVVESRRFCEGLLKARRNEILRQQTAMAN